MSHATMYIAGGGGGGGGVGACTHKSSSFCLLDCFQTRLTSETGGLGQHACHTHVHVHVTCTVHACEGKCMYLHIIHYNAHVYIVLYVMV